MNCGKTFTPPQEPPFLPRAYKYVVWQMPGEAGEGCTMDSSIMHQSIPAGPSPPRATCGHLPALSVPGVGNLQILHCPGAGHLPTPGPFPSFWHARGFLSEYNLHRRFYWKKKQIGSSVKDRNKLKRVVKACSRFYARIFLHCLSKLQSEIGAIDVNQRFLVIESNFCWYYLKNTLSYL